MYINKNFSTLLLKSFKVLNLVKHNKRFRNFCLSDETEKVYHGLEEIISICKKLKIIKKAKPPDKEVLPFNFLGSPYWTRSELFVAGKLSKNCETPIN